MYFESKETLRGASVLNPSVALKIDLTEREFDFRNVAGESLKKIENKDSFKKRHNGRSPDDGDGFVLAAAPEHIFEPKKGKITGLQSGGKENMWK